MAEFILFLHIIRIPLQVGLGLVLLAALPLAAWAWLERTRRLSPFGPLARASRTLFDPPLRPVDRVVARFGGSRSSSPWWGVFALLVLGAVLLGVVDFVRNVLSGAYYASSQGPGALQRLAVEWAIALLQLALAVRVIVSWVGGQHRWPARAATALTEWFLGPLRRALPAFGAVDISPLVAWFALSLLRGVILGALAG